MAGCSGGFSAKEVFQHFPAEKEADGLAVGGVVRVGSTGEAFGDGEGFLQGKAAWGVGLEDGMEKAGQGFVPGDGGCQVRRLLGQVSQLL